MMFSSLAKLASPAPLTLTIACDDQGLMTVTVFPQSGGAVTQPLSLTATPEELDQGFIEAVSTFEVTRETVAEQVAAAKAEVEAAGEAAIAAAKKAPKTVRGSTPRVMAQAIDDGDDDSEEEGGVSGVAVPPAAAKAVADDPMQNLFD